jgi:peptidoglycan/xylan/chitin deacetylase (PgdA/CDA1 family)
LHRNPADPDLRAPASRRLILCGLGAVILGASDADARAPAWPRGARAAVSLTYDDGLDSQLRYAVPALDAAGFKATFFLTAENVQATLPDWRRVAREGHEIADHTITHPCALGRFSAGSFRRREVAPMEALLDQQFGAARTRTFAFPCGATGLGRGDIHRRRARYLEALRGEVVAARTVAGPPNDPARVARERFRLHAFEPTYDRDDVRPAIRYVREAISQAAWAILVFHDVLPRRLHEGDTALAVHSEILSWIKAAPVWCAPMGEVFTHLSGEARDASAARAPLGLTTR